MITNVSATYDQDGATESITVEIRDGRSGVFTGDGLLRRVSKCMLESGVEIDPDFREVLITQSESEQ